MAQALQDQRAAEAATNAAAFARNVWKTTCDADPNTGQSKFYDASGNPYCATQPFVTAMDDPNRDAPNNAKITSMAVMPRTGTTPTLTGPSYPVLVDPIGWQTNQSVSVTQTWWMPVAASQPGLNVPGWRLPRRPLYVRQPTSAPTTNVSWVSINSLGVLPMLKQFTLTDDMTFNTFNGDAINVAGTPKRNLSDNTVERQGRYSWAFLYRRSNNADRTAVDITTILYSGRSLDVASQETPYLASGATGTKALTLVYTPGSQAKPAVRRGTWVLDASLWDSNSTTAINPLPQGIFYRVVNVDDSVSGNLVLELQTPLLGGPYQGPRSIVVMDKVIEVFTKKDVARVSPPMPY